jgi:hypothetical protein
MHSVRPRNGELAKSNRHTDPDTPKLPRGCGYFQAAELTSAEHNDIVLLCDFLHGECPLSIGIGIKDQGGRVEQELKRGRVDDSYARARMGSRVQ